MAHIAKVQRDNFRKSLEVNANVEENELKDKKVQAEEAWKQFKTNKNQIVEDRLKSSEEELEAIIEKTKKKANKLYNEALSSDQKQKAAFLEANEAKRKAEETMGNYMNFLLDLDKSNKKGRENQE